MRDDIVLLEDILEAIDKVQKYVKQGEKVFQNDELIQTWMIHHVQIIGEAATKLSEQIIKKYVDIPWTEIIGMRHILVHDYFGIDVSEVWSTAVNDLPVLKEKIKNILKEMGNHS